MTTNEEILPTGRSGKLPTWGVAGDIAKYTAVIAIVLFCLNSLRRKLGTFTWEQLWEGFGQVSVGQILLAMLVTSINFVILTGYDWIAVHYLKKRVPLRRIMVGAVIGYAFSNLLGWILGGSAVRYRLYSRWGFSLLEVVAFISLLSVTFWLGLFLLAGIAFVILPVRLPEEYREMLYFPPAYYGWFFLFCVSLYFLASLFIRKPITIGNQQFAFPPFRLSLLQLSVSAIDFALASLVLYILLPHGTANYSTVLVGYLAAMIVTVILHVPGGIGVLELIVLELLTRHEGATTQMELPLAVTCGLVLFRFIYYLLPGLVALLMFLRQEWYFLSERRGEEKNDIAENI
jgi:uncharacterized membrane protein YbhN (UPF0104 family)